MYFFHVALSMLGAAFMSGDMNTNLWSLIDAERAFARASSEHGVRAAFSAYLDSSSILFRPVPVNGLEWLASSPAPRITLAWRPIFADVAAAGDLGYTTGPWELTRIGQTEVLARGHYVTVWHRTQGGQWRVAVDAGTSTPAWPGTDTAVTHPAYQGPPRIEHDYKGATASLMEHEQTLAARAAESGLMAFAELADDDIRFYRPEQAPLLGRIQLATMLASATRKPIHYTPTSAVIAESGDMGYTYGTVLVPDAEKGDDATIAVGYLRIWKRLPGGEWRLVLDVL